MGHKNPKIQAAYDKEYQTLNREKILIRRRKYYQREEVIQRKRATARKRHSKWVSAAMAGYDNRCLFCRMDNKLALVFHHVDGNGYEHKRKMGGSYGFFKWVVDNGFPNEIVLLCANCHTILHKMEKCND
jgi:hypothetical protein